MRILLVSKDCNFSRRPYEACGKAFEKYCEKFPVVYERISRSFKENVKSDYFVPAKGVPGGTYYKRVEETLPNPAIEEWKAQYEGCVTKENHYGSVVMVRVYEETEGLFLSEMGFSEFVQYCLDYTYGIESPDGEFEDVDACLIVEDDS